MDDLAEMVAPLLRPAGGGIYTVSSGRARQLSLQRSIYGVATEAEVDSRWRDTLREIATARVCVLAIPSDTGAGLIRGAAFGPTALREALLEVMPDFGARARRAGVVDIGDVFVVPQLLHDEMLSDSQRQATQAAIFPTVEPSRRSHLPVAPLSMGQWVLSRCLEVNPSLKFMLLGGDHSVAWPMVAALAAHRPRPFAILHPDAHTDLLPERLGVKYCFATWAYHANNAIGRSGRLVQVGIRASSRTREHWESTLGVRQFWADALHQQGEARALDEILAYLHSLGVQDVYLSNDIDGTDSAAAPATGAPEPAGLSESFVRGLIRRVGREMSLIGADLVEIAPPIGDPAGARQTVALGARYMLDTLVGLTGSDAFVI
jgi:arginase family enzyme